jgi:hypothetical protein
MTNQERNIHIDHDRIKNFVLNANDAGANTITLTDQKTNITLQPAQYRVNTEVFCYVSYSEHGGVGDAQAYLNWDDRFGMLSTVYLLIDLARIRLHAKAIHLLKGE